MTPIDLRRQDSLENRKKVVRLKRRKTINLGFILFFIIFIYIAIYTIVYFTKPHLSIYEVQRETLSSDSIAMGVIVREETVYYMNKAGYVNYYLRDGARVKKDATVYSLDENRNIYDTLANNGNELTLEENDILSVKSKITNFRKKFAEDYSVVYSFQEEISGTIRQLSDENLLAQLQELMDETGVSSSFQTITSDSSGIITYHVDSLDGLAASEVTAATFDQENFTEGTTRIAGASEQGSKVYKLITSDTWSVVVPVSEEVYQYYSERTSAKITIAEDDFTVTVPISLELRGAQPYATLTFDKYLNRYLDYRFLTIEFQMNVETGLKIPISSIVEKEFFIIPIRFFTYGGDSGNRGVMKVNYETGEPVYTFVETEVYYENEEYGYVEKELFDLNTFLFDQNETDPQKQIQRVSLVDTLEGVYNINKGFAVFRRIERIRENEDYCIIKEGTSAGVALYDHIALDATTAVEASVIY